MFNKKYTTPVGLQLSLIISSVAMYVVGFLQTVNLVVQQAATNPNFSGMWSFMAWQALPALLFGLAYFLNPRKKLDQTSRMFETTVITIIGLAAFTVLSQLASYLMSLSANWGDNYTAYELSVMVIMLVAFGGVLWFLSRTKRWK